MEVMVMCKKDKTFLFFFLFGALVNSYLYFAEVSELIKGFVILGLVISYMFYEIMERLFIMKSKQDVVFDLLWYMSFNQELEEHERETIREKLRDIKKLET